MTFDKSDAASPSVDQMTSTLFSEVLDKQAPPRADQEQSNLAGGQAATDGQPAPAPEQAEQSQSSWVAVQQDSAANSQGTKADAEARAVKIMEDWKSAYKKANSGWFTGGLTAAEIDSALAGKELSEGERTALTTMKDNFDDISALDGLTRPVISKSDLALAEKLITNSARDVQFYDAASQFLAENREKLDANKDGKIQAHELFLAKENPEFAKSAEVLEYLNDRYNNRLKHTDIGRTSLAFMTFGEQSVQEGDFKPGDVHAAVRKTQELAYNYQNVDDYRNVVSSIAMVGGLFAAKYFKLGKLATVGTVLGATAGTGALGAGVSRLTAPSQQAEQDERIQQLSTKVANLKY